MNKKLKVNIYTDGSHSSKTNKGGYCGLLECEGHKCMVFGNEENTTNNRMELSALLDSLKVLNQPCDITIHADSNYVLNPIGKKWLKTWEKNDWINSSNLPVKNEELWKEVNEEIKKHKITINKVKAHSGHFENELCDQVAKIEAGIK